MSVVLYLMLIAVVFGFAVKLAGLKRDWFGVSLSIALTVTGVVFAAALTVCVIRDCAAYSDCVSACMRPTDIEVAFPTAFVAGYGFALLVLVALVRGLLVALARRRTNPPESRAS